MTQPQSQLAKYAHLSRQPDPTQAFELARQAWHDHGIVCINPVDQRDKIGWVAARIARNLGEQCFGKRKGGG